MLGFEALINSCEKRFGSLCGKKILDISCHDGKLLRLFQEKGAITIGVRSEHVCHEIKNEDALILSNKCTKDGIEKIAASYGTMDFITSTTYVENIHDFLNLFKNLITIKTVIVIENHCLNTMLDSKDFNIFYGDFPKIYKYSIFMQIAQFCQAKFIDIEYPANFIGNIRVFLWNAAISSVLGNTIGDEDLCL